MHAGPCRQGGCTYYFFGGLSQSPWHTTFQQSKLYENTATCCLTILMHCRSTSLTCLSTWVLKIRSAFSVFYLTIWQLVPEWPTGTWSSTDSPKSVPRCNIWANSPKSYIRKIDCSFILRCVLLRRPTRSRTISEPLILSLYVCHDFYHYSLYYNNSIVKNTMVEII